MAGQRTRFYTPEEYLERERQAESKSEYLDGRIYALAGATRTHNILASNASRELSAQLRGRPCETYSSDMRVRVSTTGLYTYPDIVVVCGEPAFLDEQEDTLLNSTVLIEVLSDSTEAYDRGEKFAHYRHLESLREYVLVSHQMPRIERYERQPEGRWLLSVAEGLEGLICLPSIGCELRLAEVYDRVAFEQPTRQR